MIAQVSPEARGLAAKPGFLRACALKTGRIIGKGHFLSERRLLRWREFCYNDTIRAGAGILGDDRDTTK